MSKIPGRNNSEDCVATEFEDYAINWWDQLVTKKRCNGEFSIETQAERNTVMRTIFVPNYYYHELHHKLRRLRQGSRSVEKYYHELESVKIKARLDENHETTMARFIGGLNRDIQD